MPHINSTAATKPLLATTIATLVLAFAPSLRAAPGDLKWAFRTDGAVRSSPALGTNGLLYFGSADSKIYALEAATGAKRWELGTGSSVISSPAIGPDGTVFIGSTDGYLYACDGATGRKRWSFLSGQVFSSPALGANGLLYFTTWNGTIYALNTASGKQVWTGSLNANSTYASPSIGADGVVLCASGGFSGGNPEGGSFFAFEGATGQIRWQFNAVNAIQSTPAIAADGTIFFSSYDKLVYALDPLTGAKKWGHLTGDSISSSPTIGADGILYVGSNDGRLYALDSKDGSEKWTFLTGDTIHSSPAVASDGTVYFGSYNRKVYAVDGRTGSEKWHFKTGGQVLSSPLIGADGTVFIGSQDGQVRALEGTSPSAQSSWPAFKGGAQRTGSVEHSGPPVMVLPPGNILVAQGGDTVLDAVVQGTRPIRFQWLFNGKPLMAETTTSRLEIATARFDDVGQYTLIATNALGEVRASARLDVGFVLTIKQEGGGQVVAQPDQDVYLPGTLVRVTANPNEGGSFRAWHGDLSGQANPATIIMTNDRLAAATFAVPPGKKLWDIPFQLKGMSAAAIGNDNTIFVTGDATELLAIDGDTGFIKWQFNAPSTIQSSAAIGDDGTVVFGFQPNFICAINGKTGALKWKVAIDESSNLTPSIGPDGVVYVCTESFNAATLIALNGTNGAMKWRYNAGPGLTFRGTSPSIGTNGIVYITTGCDWTVTAVDAATGKARWKSVVTLCLAPDGSDSPVALGGEGSVYIQSGNGVFYALDAMTGAIRWKIPFSIPGSGVPIVGKDETIFLLNGGNHCVAIDGRSGQIKSAFNPSAAANITPTAPALASDGTLYATSSDSLLALDSGNGQLKWAATVPGLTQVPLTIGPDGAVYVVSSINNETRLMAIRGTAPLADGPWPMAGNNARNTSAFDGSLPIRVKAIAILPSDVRVTVRTKFGRLHHLEFKTSFQQSDWTGAATATGDGSEMTLHDSQSGATQRFYRIRVE